LVSCTRSIVRRDRECWTHVAFWSSGRICGTHRGWRVVDPRFSETLLSIVVLVALWHAKAVELTRSKVL
jgi:hypothetical protein